MGKLIKWLLIAVSGLIGLVVVAVAAIVILVDPNDYRGDISRLVQENTGQELVIEGDISLSFFPWLGLDLGRTRLENRDGFGDQPFVEVESVGIAVELLPLLRQEIVMDVIRLDGLLVHLVRNEQGDANWELDLPGSGDEVPGEAPDEPSPSDDEGDGDGAPPVAIGRLGGIELTDLRLIYEDRQAGTRQEVGPANVSLGEIDLDDDIMLSADWSAALEGDLRIEGELESLLRVSPDFQQISVAIDELGLRTFAPGLPDSGLETTLSADLAANLEDGTAELTALRLRTAELDLTAEADVRQLTSDPTVSGRFALAEADLRDVLDALGQAVPETADPDVLTVFSMTGMFNADGDAATIDELAIRLDDSAMEASVAVSDFANPLIGFDVDVDSFNADRYLPPPSEEDPAPVEAAGEDAESEGEPVELPMELLRGLRLDGRFHLGELIISELLFEDLTVTVAADGGQIRLHPIGARLYDGEYSGDIRIDARGEQAEIAVDERVQGVRAGPLVTHFMGNELLEGTGNLTVDASAEGVEVMDLVRTLVGQAEFRFTDGAVLGINIAQMVRNATARLQGQSAADGDEPARTDFAELDGRVTFDRGIVRIEALNIQSPLLRVTGGGEANLLEQSVDYRLTVNLVGTLQGQDGEALENLRRLPIPLRIQGALLSPSISLDLQAALTDQQRERLREEEEALRQQAREAEDEARARVEEEREEAEQRAREELQEREGEVRDRARDELRRLLR